ncbi:hypothetical protein A2U01_0087063, partial [Trifolium medium]|nr:hypothetical protein [Trifolium medium]
RGVGSGFCSGGSVECFVELALLAAASGCSCWRSWSCCFGGSGGGLVLFVVGVSGFGGVCCLSEAHVVVAASA